MYCLQKAYIKRSETDIKIELEFNGPRGKMADLQRRPSWTLGTGLSRRGRLALHSHMVSVFPCFL